MYKTISKRIQGGKDSRALRDQIDKQRWIPVRETAEPPPLEPKDVIRLFHYDRLRQVSPELPKRDLEMLPDWLARELRRRGLRKWLAEVGRLKANAKRAGRVPLVRRRAAKSSGLASASSQTTKQATSATTRSARDTPAMRDRRLALAWVRNGMKGSPNGIARWVQLEAERLGKAGWLQLWEQRLLALRPAQRKQAGDTAGNRTDRERRR